MTRRWAGGGSLPAHRRLRVRVGRLSGQVGVARSDDYGAGGLTMSGVFGIDLDRGSDALGVGGFLAIPSATMPAWLGDGRLAFLSDATDVPQIWVTETPVRVGAPVSRTLPMTTFADRIGALLAAPGGGRLVFGMDIGGNERQQLWTVAPGEE